MAFWASIEVKQRLMHYMPSPAVAALSETPILATTGEDTSVPMMCQVAEALAPLK